jgi:MFS family permease
LVVVASNQFSGTNSILYYAKQLFNKVTDNDLHLTQLLIILLSVVQLLAVIMSTQIIDKIGRKVMILRGQASVSVCLILISIFDIIFK